MNHLTLGAWGEQLACLYLKKKGYILLFKNWRWKKAEIDIIAFHDNFIVIIEVKTRSYDLFGSPSSAINLKKEEKIREGALSFLENYELDYELKFEVISVLGNEKNYQLEHIENAF